MEWVAALLFVTVVLVLLAGFPVAFTLAGTALVFATIGVLAGSFSEALLLGMPNRIFGIMTNETLVAVPLFVFMGVTLERARIAEDLLETLSSLFGALRGGLGVSVMLVGMLLAASTGIVTTPRRATRTSSTKTWRATARARRPTSRPPSRGGCRRTSASS